VARAAPLALVLGLTLAAGALADGDAERAFKRAWARARGDAAAQESALGDLAAAGGPDAAALLARIALADDVAASVRDRAEALLHDLDGAEVSLWAAEVLDDERDDRLRAVAAGYLAARAERDPHAGLLLRPALEDDAWSVQAAAVRGLARVRRPEVVATLVRFLPDADGRVAADCRDALARLTGERFGSAEEWTSWWATRKDGYALPDPDARGDAEEPSRHRTVTRLDAPADAGRTIYGAIESSRVVFVVDVSSSMQVRAWADDGGARPLTRLEYVQTELAAAIEEQLDADDEFGIVVFSTEVHPWKRELVKASDRNRSRAAGFVRDLRPEGGTNISGALEAAFAYEDVDTIYFLSDGTPTEGELRTNADILAAIRQWNAGRGVRLNAVAFLAGDGEAWGVAEDKGMAERSLRALADANDGTFALFD